MADLIIHDIDIPSCNKVCIVINRQLNRVTILDSYIDVHSRVSKGSTFDIIEDDSE